MKIGKIFILSAEIGGKDTWAGLLRAIISCPAGETADNVRDTGGSRFRGAMLRAGHSMASR